MTQALARTPDDEAIDQAVVRLTEEFRTQLRPQVIGTVVRSCRRDLSGVPTTALPELVERLARTRLQTTDLSA
ncbi:MULTISPECIES: three-helix bundle dimerization domain-containing protein [unclassified Blastococcus]